MHFYLVADIRFDLIILEVFEFEEDYMVKHVVLYLVQSAKITDIMHYALSSGRSKFWLAEI